uniref:B box-type domain-containing protein n=1 Tax=Romanomermis culicivorax TaxID=13658 RepID=A0A915ISV0_ROMCU
MKITGADLDMEEPSPNDRSRQCILCQNSIVNLNSYVLRCLHIACASCIQSSKESSIFCVNCDLSTNIEELKKRLLYLNDESSRCDCNDKDLIVTRCVECEEFLCLACEIAHRRVKLSKNHQLIKIRGSNSLDDFETISFCKTCNQKTEPSCETSMHDIRKFLPVSIEDQYKRHNAIDEEYLRNLLEKNDSCVERIVQCRKEELVIISNQINDAMKADIDSIDSEKTIVHSKNLRNQIIFFSAMPHFADIALPMLNEAQSILSERLDQKYVADAKKSDLNSMKNHIISILNAISVSSSPEYVTSNDFDAVSNEGHSEQGPAEKIIPNSFNTKKNFIASSTCVETMREIPMDVNMTIMKLDYVGPATSTAPEPSDQNQRSSLCGSKKRKRSFHVASGKSTPPLRLKLRLTGIDGLTTENESAQIENHLNHVDANEIPSEEGRIENPEMEPLKEARISEKEKIVNILDVSGGSLNSLIVIDPLMEKENLESRNNHNETKSSTQAQVGNDEDEKEWDSFCSVCGKSDQPLVHCHSAMCLRSFHFDHHVPPVFQE